MRKFRIAAAFADGKGITVDINSPTLIGAAAHQLSLMANEQNRIIAWSGQEVAASAIITPNGRFPMPPKV